MDYLSTREAVVGILETVPDIGVVHNRDRYAASTRDLLDLFYCEITNPDPDDPAPTIKVLRGWMVSRTAAPVFTEDASWGNVVYNQQITIKGLYGFDDEGDSDGQFQALIDRVIAALNTASSFGAGSDFVNGAEPAFLHTSELRMFSGLLAHYCEIVVAAPFEEALNIT